ncbi:exodeoxyribonuclease VII large subunit [Parapedobacter sp. 10938]|uniref:exodeoxyribonuclease VII large subunit n=1 Tax=Parapedobacter flavus TaxID=3110225 RepID=UPI002DB96D3C|nr:exodeoxyribonuclease VII large subunit [Parapedobacter sp. 10938]MEC3877984.1 exodeoxyribonuclease VII large subunit [Parapedobacter sp. 10938]
MPEKFSDKTVFSLVEVARSIQKTIAERYKSVYWVKAEMNKLNHYSHSGHCYPELVEKREGRVVAEMRSVLWKGDYQRINQQFIETTKEPLKNGITILFQAAISYDPVYGLTLRILDIDPVHALGELQREKLASINRLKEEGVFKANKSLTFPVVPKRLAIISVETSKGYADFLKILQHNPWGYRFEQTLFPALLQGDKSVQDIITQLEGIAKQQDLYDVVAIIRGGGGDVGLSSYNHYALAVAIARFPIPVLTGIGHSTNETVSEMVAYRNAITPSELADFLIQRFHRFAEPVNQAREIITRKAQQQLSRERNTLDDLIRYFRLHSIHLVNGQQKALEYGAVRLGMVNIARLRHGQQQLQHATQTLKTATSSLLKDKRSDLLTIEKTVYLLDPRHVLRRGYSITRLNGKALKSTEPVREGDIVETVLAQGSMTSKIDKLKPLDNG